MTNINFRIAEELAVKENQVAAAVKLLDEGSTVPFVARYRKEATGGLDDTQLRTLEERLGYLRELEDRRHVILKSIDEQGKLSPTLKLSINQADTKSRLEDLYLPYKQKRRTKAQIAREAGLAPLAQALFDDPNLSPEEEAKPYIDSEKDFADVKAVLDGARQILMEQFAEDADLLQLLRQALWQDGVIEAKVIEGKEVEGAKFKDYFQYQEPLLQIPSHRALALFRGRNEGILQFSLKMPVDQETQHDPCIGMITHYLDYTDQQRPGDAWLAETIRWTWKIKLFSHLEVELKLKLKSAAEEEAIKVFAANMKDLLLASPAGPKATLGLDPGLRTGVKVAVVDHTGKFVDHDTIYPHVPKRQWDQSLATLAKLCKKHKVQLISIGNGTASRETDKLAKDLIKQHPELRLNALVVSEAGASVYSASELAAKEFPNLDVSIRGAVSIARRLQDPLAELVKIEPKAIGVGQYQHDVSQTRLSKSLNAVVEDCVNAVGVDLNMASAPLLTQVSGLSLAMAENIVSFRDSNGAFNNRETLLKVPRLGPKAYEQAAGFLRVMDGDNPLDRSAVHPEAYCVVKKIMEMHSKSVNDVIGHSQFLRTLLPKDYIDDNFGTPTIVDIISELEKPGRDPRPEFKTAAFKDGIEELKDLKPNMILEGVVTNVTNFGAFIDIGVHQDGLVHISSLANRFVKDPREVVKTGDVVKVKVMEVDIPRKRIGLTMRLEDESENSNNTNNTETKHNSNRQKSKKNQSYSAKTAVKKASPPQNSAMGNALAEALLKSKK